MLRRNGPAAERPPRCTYTTGTTEIQLDAGCSIDCLLDRITQCEATSARSAVHCYRITYDELVIADVGAIVGHMACGIMTLAEERLNVSWTVLRHLVVIVLFGVSYGSSVVTADGMFPSFKLRDFTDALSVRFSASCRNLRAASSN
jgi:hypothetical protein